jgi:hypothetical protein
MLSKHKHILTIFFLLFALSVVPGCHRKIAAGKSAKQEKDNSTIADNNGFTPATVVYLTLDGCAWMLKLEDGKLLQPYQLEPEFQKENLKVLIKYTINKKAMGICMSGTIVNLTAIKLDQ